MEVRDFTGCFVLDGRELEEMDLRVILSVGGGGLRAGSGSFALPMALVGRAEQAVLTFRTSGGDEISLRVREVDLVDGVAYFLTEGDVPQAEDGGAGQSRSAS